MKKKNLVLKVGDRVGLMVSEYNDDEYSDPVTGKLRYDEDNLPEYGTVSGLVGDDQVAVKWDGEWYAKYNTDPVDISTLGLEADVKKLITKLEDEFNEAEKQVKEKLKEAGKLVKEANKLAKKTGRDLANMYDAVRPLVNAMDASGWRSSSWGC